MVLIFVLVTGKLMAELVLFLYIVVSVMDLPINALGNLLYLHEYHFENSKKERKRIKNLHSLTTCGPPCAFVSSAPNQCRDLIQFSE